MGVYTSGAALKNVYYAGTYDDWEKIAIGEGNELLIYAYDASATGEANGLIWTVEDGVLTISGNDSIPPYASDLPWANLRSMILEVVIEEGITGGALHEFYFPNVSKITVPVSFSSILGMTFDGIDRVDIYYQGIEEQWDAIEIFNEYSEIPDDTIPDNVVIHFKTDISKSLSTAVGYLQDNDVLNAAQMLQQIVGLS